MRVLHVVTHMNRGGLETMIMNYYRHIDRNKIQFDFLTHREYDGDYGDEIKALGGKIYHLPRLNPFSIDYKRKLNQFFIDHPEYKIIHVHQDCMSSVILKAAKKNGVIFRIAHSHSNSQDKDIKYLIKLFYKHLIPRYATDLFACSEDAGKWMFNGAPFTVINNAIDAKKYSFNDSIRKKIRYEFGIDESIFVIGHVGRFSYPKNHKFLVNIFEQVSKTNNAVLMLVGDGELRPEIENIVKSKGLEDKVIFTGIRKDVNDLLQAMDVFVFPSNYEGLPVSVIEAQAAGLPCFISDKVPIECKKTELVHQISLSEPADIWADSIMKFYDYIRQDAYIEILNNGYDIKDNSEKLMEYYLSLK